MTSIDQLAAAVAAMTAAADQLARAEADVVAAVVAVDPEAYPTSRVVELADIRVRVTARIADYAAGIAAEVTA